LILTGLALSVPGVGGQTVIYFYNPDANLADVAKLKSEVQAYFRGIDPSATLKAFVRLPDLLDALKTEPPDFLVAASWVTKQYAVRSGFKPLLVGQVGSSRAYNKVLISKKMVTGVSPSLSLVGQEQTVEDIKSIVPELRKYASLNVVEVTKDLDAVLAVSFEQVDLALVRPQNIEAIRKVNQLAVADVKVLARSTPIEYPIFSAFSKTDAPLVEKFVKGLQAARDPKSSQALDLMGFESWGVR
jgi:hypothetical protein